MAWHRIDYDGLWSSDKLSRCSVEAQADYEWVYGILLVGSRTAHVEVHYKGANEQTGFPRYSSHYTSETALLASS
jgi:hypothetical protein